MALAPLHEAFGITRLFVATMQAVSGAGYPGVPSLDILGNVIPYIADEEPKIETEIQQDARAPAWRRASSTRRSRSARTPTASRSRTDTRSACRSTSSEHVDARRRRSRCCATGTGDAACARSAERARAARCVVTDAPDRPQPRRDVDRRRRHDGHGRPRARATRSSTSSSSRMGHNTIRGAAGASVLNAELLVATRTGGHRVIVCKFGGTSVGDAEAIARTAAIVAGRRDRQPIVVVSALAGATNALLAIAEQAAKGQLIGALRGVEALARAASRADRNDSSPRTAGARRISRPSCRRCSTSSRRSPKRSPRSAT